MPKTTLIRVLNLDYDLIEIHYNDTLKNKPYLIRVFNYDQSEPKEFRIDENEIKNLYALLREYGIL